MRHLIASRRSICAGTAVSIWPYFGQASDEQPEDDSIEAPSVAGSVPSLVHFRGEEIAVQSWVDVAVATIEGIVRIGDEEFRRVVEDLPRFVNFDATTFRRSSRLRRLSNDAYLETNLSATSINRWCLQATQLAGVELGEWTVDYRLDGAEDGDVLTERQIAYKAFFQNLIDELRDVHQFTGARIGQPQNWYSFASSVSGFKYGVSFAKGGRIRSELYIDQGDREASKAAFDRLLAEREAIEKDFGGALVWDRLDRGMASRIALFTEGAIWDSPAQLESYGKWAVETLLRFKRAFDPRLRLAAAQQPTTA